MYKEMDDQKNGNIDYYEMQRPNLLYPNEEYINSKENVNKADLVRMKHVYEDNNIFFSGGAMLDVGCNDGYFMRHFDWGFDRYIGIDMFSINEYLRTEDITGYDKDGKIVYQTGIFEDMELGEKFDFIFAGEIIEHVENVERFLKKIQICLSNKGSACFTTPNNIGISQPEHYRQYNKQTLRKQLEKFFTVEKIEELPSINNSWPFLYARVKGRGSL